MDLNYDSTHLAGRTILITGGASGFGAAFSTRWATAGAQIIIGDINPAGAEVVARMRTETGNDDIHFIQLDVTSWTSQVSFFREAVQLSNHGGIDAVVANAGVSDGAEAHAFENPKPDYLDGPIPSPPSLRTVEINLIGVMYTVHLALSLLPKNPDSKPCEEATNELSSPRDRHILLLGSVSSLHPLPTQSPYSTTKHAILGLFRCLRVSAPVTAGVRVNIVCPYYTDTGVMSAAAKVILAGVPIGRPEDVVEAATYLVANKKCIGRSLVTGPKLKLDIPDNVYMRGDDALEKVKYVVEKADVERPIWEVRLHDVDTADVFTKRMIRIVAAVTALRGWVGWAQGMAGAVKLWWWGKR
ncbi:putative short chain dehydrogenase/reductase [Aspergillus heteromorphus CBS 117.55]|uniref:Putative short chain dehydrogenase/reductase n=1 Tax=Aspergillus heteromorphus CBS 117.55 TaxID=1448321 RepID=A0A317WWE5_9EURO|nr:putative short chain dehydrogenase/reductase [Aspergillus heteromorphus CBS 117.55]PWY90714.1 putative short chain dehydrogenase/reductase [Aspergillus heteromorphus CBS 117.55]